MDEVKVGEAYVELGVRGAVRPGLEAAIEQAKAAQELIDVVKAYLK
jgi:hypothetical protein